MKDIKEYIGSVSSVAVTCSTDPHLHKDTNTTHQQHDINTDFLYVLLEKLVCSVE